MPISQCLDYRSDFVVFEVRFGDRVVNRWRRSAGLNSQVRFVWTVL